VEKKDILNSWKEISNYLDRNTRTCLRWEAELGLPVHRIDKDSSRSKVFAYKSEIDRWLKEKAGSKEIKKSSFLEKRWSIIGLISVLALLSTIFVFLLLTNRISISPPPENLSFAVLPFENLNPSKHEEYFSAGVTNEIVNRLTMLNKLRVVPAISVSKYNSIKDKNQIAEELSVDYILEGKIKKDGNNIKIYVQLIRTKDYKDIWSEEFEDRLENILSIHENICRKIHEKLNLNIDQNLLLLSNERKTQDYLAYDNYLKGNLILNRISEDNGDPWKLYYQGNFYSGKTTQESNELAINLFRQAIEIDQNFVLAYIGLANCYTNYVNLNWNFDIKWMNKAEDLVKKARSMSPGLPEYYSTLTKIYLIKEIGFSENTKTLAFELAQEGIKKYPNHPQLNSIIGYCYYLKFGEEGNDADFDKALEYKEKSFWLNPLRLDNFVYAELLMLNKEFYKAIEVCNIIVKHDSTSMAKLRLGEIYYYMGDLDKSKTIFRQFDIAPLDLKIASLFFLGMISSQTAEREKALRIIDEISIISPEEFVLYDYFRLASIYMSLGMKESGYEYLRYFFNKPLIKKMLFVWVKYIDIDKNFDRVREEEEFIKIIKNKGEN